MRLALVLLLASMTAPAVAGERSSAPRPGVEITESTAVVYALDCPRDTTPVWQPLEIRAVVVAPDGREWLGTGYATVCGVAVAGTEVEIILACQRRDGTHHGPVASWYAGGAIRTRGGCRDGLATGRWTRSEVDGRPGVEGEFTRGKRVGRWRYWDSDGHRRTLPVSPPSGQPVF